MSSAVKLILCLVVTFSASAVGAIFSSSIGEWYDHLARPAISPPNWVFGPVWFTLYTMMAAAAWQIWRTVGWPAAAAALTSYLVQLTLNAAWTWLFFGLRRPEWAFAEIVVLWIAILATMVLFWRASRSAGLLFLPYLAWVSFAAYLNFEFWQLNR